MEADCCHPGVWEKDGARGFCSHTSQTSVCKTLLHWCSLSRVCLPSVFQVHFPPVAHTALHWFKKIHSILYWDHSRDRGGRDGLVCGFLFVFVLFCLCIGDMWNSRNQEWRIFCLGEFVVCFIVFSALSPSSSLQSGVCFFSYLFHQSVRPQRLKLMVS